MSDPISRPSLESLPEYYRQYVAKIEDDDLLQALRAEGIETRELLRDIPEDRGGHRYAEGKWSIKQLVAHLVDCERIFVFRALCFSRGEGAELPGFDENAYAAEAEADGRSLASLIEEFDLVRAATIAFFAGLSQRQLDRRGTANAAELSARGIGFIVAGHNRHHRGILRERYL